MRFTIRTAWLIVLAAFLIFYAGCAAKKEETTFVRDKWSEDCPNGTYYVLDDEEGFRCSPLRTCMDDADCVYLKYDKIPPRVGKCVEHKCKAYCGSGKQLEC